MTRRARAGALLTVPRRGVRPLDRGGAQHVESTSRLVNDEFARPDHSLHLRIAFASRSAGNLSNLRQSRHRNLSKPGIEAIEPLLYADRCDRKSASCGVVNPFDASVPRGDARRRERPFAPQPPGDERGQMKADHLVRIKVLVEADPHSPALHEFDERTVIGRHAWRRDDVQLRTDGGEDIGLEHALDDHNPGVARKIGELEPEMERTA